MNIGVPSHFFSSYILFSIFFLPTTKYLGFLKILGLITPFIDNWTHLGGLVYGMCCAFSILPTVDVSFLGVNKKTWQKRIRTFMVRFMGIIVTCFFILISTIFLATYDISDGPPCPGCRFMSCIPFPPFQEKKWRYCDDCDTVVGDLYMDATKTYYTQIDLTCPDDITIETINVTSFNIANVEIIQQKLPTYCRQHCANVYSH